MPHGPLSDVLVLLALSVLAVALLRRLHLPPILGYLFVGRCVGIQFFNHFKYPENNILVCQSVQWAGQTGHCCSVTIVWIT